MRFKKLDIKKVEKDLEDLIVRLRLTDISVAWVKDFTYNFGLPTNQISKKYFGKLMDMLPKDTNEEDFEKAMTVFNNAWNVFPQKILGGQSPQEKMFEEMEKEKQKEKKNQNNGLVSPLSEELLEKHFEYAEEHLEHYMNWAYKEVMPTYQKYIKNLKLPKKRENEHLGIAAVFLEMCGHAGMLELSALPIEFVSDFPDLFTKTVIGPKIKKEHIVLYLNTFLSFLDTLYGITISAQSIF